MFTVRAKGGAPSGQSWPRRTTVFTNTSTQTMSRRMTWVPLLRAALQARRGWLGPCIERTQAKQGAGRWMGSRTLGERCTHPADGRAERSMLHGVVEVARGGCRAMRLASRGSSRRRSMGRQRSSVPSRGVRLKDGSAARRAEAEHDVEARDWRVSQTRTRAVDVVQVPGVTPATSPTRAGRRRQVTHGLSRLRHAEHAPASGLVRRRQRPHRADAPPGLSCYSVFAALPSRVPALRGPRAGPLKAAGDRRQDDEHHVEGEDQGLQYHTDDAEQAPRLRQVSA
jgi:hypothetical protein